MTLAPATLARAYFGLQAGLGAAWWAAVYASDDVRTATLGGIEPNLLVVPDLVLFVGASAVAALRGGRMPAAVVAGWSTLVTAGLLVYGLLEEAAGAGIVLMVVATGCTWIAASLLWWGRVPLGWFFVGPFAFHEADDASPAHHLRRSLLQLVVFWTTFFVGVPAVLVSVERRLGLTLEGLASPSWQVVGLVGLALGSALGLWSCVSMALVGRGTPLPAATARALVVVGPYRHVRNPMAVAGGIQTASVGLLVGSWSVVVIALAGAVVWDVAIRPTEEADLADRFGVPYERYRGEVRCWVPTRGRTGSYPA